MEIERIVVTVSHEGVNGEVLENQQVVYVNFVKNGYSIEESSLIEKLLKFAKEIQKEVLSYEN